MVTEALDIYLGTASSDPLELTVEGSRLYFTAVDSGGRQVRWLDSTNTVTAIPAPPAGNSADAPAQLAYANGLLFFVADNAAAGLGRQLFVYSPGTPGSTAPHFELNAGPVGDVYSELVPFSNQLYFAVRDEATMRYELWRTDGTTKVRVTFGGTPLFGAKNLREARLTGTSYLWLAADAPGTPGVTQLYKVNLSHAPSQVPGCSSDPGDFLSGGTGAYAGRVYFACSGAQGRELFRTDGTTVSPLPDLNAGGDSNPRPLKAIGDRLYFAADDGLHGEEMHYVLNGQYLESPSDFDFVKGAVGSSPRDLVEVTLPLLPSFWHFTIQEGTVRTLWGIESL